MWAFVVSEAEHYTKVVTRAHLQVRVRGKAHKRASTSEGARKGAHVHSIDQKFREKRRKTFVTHAFVFVTPFRTYVCIDQKFREFRRKNFVA